MPLRHQVLLTLGPEAAPDAADRIVEALRALPAEIPQIVEYHVGRDLGLRDGTADLALTAVFASADDWRTYVAHPSHVAVVRELIDPNCPDRISVQFED